MKALVGYGALGAFAYLGFSLALLPAQRALDLALPYAEARGLAVTASDPAGTLWRGHLGGLEVNGLELRQLDWRLGVFPLLTGRLAGSWSGRLEGGTVHGRASADLSGNLHLRNLEAQLAVPTLTGRLGLPFAADGELAVSLDHLAFRGEQPVSAEGVATWRDARLTAPFEARLGELQVRLHPRRQGGITAELGDGGGPLRVEGKAELQPDGRYRVDALLAAGPGADRALREGLPLIGRRAPDGRYHLAFEGDLRQL